MKKQYFGLKESSVFGGGWAPYIAYDVYWEWRWENDRHNFEREIREEEKREEEAFKKFPKPKKMLDDETF